MNKKTKKCSICEKRYALLDLTPILKKDLLICVQCLEEKMKKGELPAIDKEGYKYINQLIENLPAEMKSKDETSLATVEERQEQPDLFLLEFGRDLTDLARTGKLDPVIGRDQEIARMVLVLSRRGKNNPILIGEPGVGKTANVEGLAQRIASGDVPASLKKKRVVSLNIGSLIAGTKYRGEFEGRIKKIVEEVTENKQIILFVDEFHTIIGAGGAEGAVDASNLLKPALSRGEIQMIGATTLDEYRKYVEKDAALSRRFQAIEVNEPTLEQAFIIMEGLKNHYETFHGVHIEDDAIRASVQLSEKYVSDRFLPDKAIDLLDEACALKKMNTIEPEIRYVKVEKELREVTKLKDRNLLEEKFEEAREMRQRETALRVELDQLAEKHNEKVEKNMTVQREDIAKVLEQWTGIPVTQLKEEDKSRLKTLENDLKKEVKGQDEAVEVIAKSVRRSQLGLKDPKRPMGVFMFLGPTGVGKTELAKTLANLMYGSEDAMLRFDMSEYMEKHTVSKLIGAPPGYVGYDDEGKLTKVLRRKPYSLVLFDEVEKAHPDVMNVMLQLFEDGRITDNKGRVVDAKNAIFILTSNAGSDVYTSGGTKSVGFSGIRSAEQETKSIRDKVLETVKQRKMFRPEFMNRLDATVVFNLLSKEVMREIVDKMVDEFTNRVNESGYKVEFAEEALDHLAKIGYAPEFGARQLRREVERVGDLIGDMYLEDEDKVDFTVVVEEEKLKVK